MMFGWIRLILGGLFLTAGMCVFLIELDGVFHLKYVLNRMHAAALGDTLGLSLSMIGLMILSGLNFTTLKMALVVLFVWCASPVSSHMLARLEVATNENLNRHCKLYDIEDGELKERPMKYRTERSDSNEEEGQA